MATLLIVRRPVARVAPQRARERRRGLRAEAESAQRRAHGLDRPEALRLRIERLGHLTIGGTLVVWIPSLRVQNLHCVHLANPVAHLPGVHPDGELRWQVLEDVLNGHAALFRRPFENRVHGVASL